MTHRAAPVALTLSLPLLLAACAGSSRNGGDGTATPARPPASTRPAAGGIQQVTIETTDQLRFTPMAIRAHVGRLRIVLVDHGSYPHNIALPAMHATSTTVSGSPGQQQTVLTVTLTHVGTYDFVCTFHSSAGMKGQISVA